MHFQFQNYKSRVTAKVKVRFDQQTHTHFELPGASADFYSRRD
jgi:hypothetical protein